MRYRQLNTGLTYQAVHDMMKDYRDDPADWTYKRRHTVLGKWHQLKKEMWAYHLWECEQQRRFEQGEHLVHGDAYEPPGAVNQHVEGVPF